MTNDIKIDTDTVSATHDRRDRPLVMGLLSTSPEAPISHGRGTAFHVCRALMEATYVVTGGVWPERDEPSATS